MRRELAGMTLDQAAKWESEQCWEVLRAAELGRISEAVFHSLLDGIINDYTEYLRAYSMGLIVREG